jgi:hypothetical protein
MAKGGKAARRRLIQRNGQGSRAGETFRLQLMQDRVRRGTQLDPVEIVMLGSSFRSPSGRESAYVRCVRGRRDQHVLQLLPNGSKETLENRSCLLHQTRSQSAFDRFEIVGCRRPRRSPQCGIEFGTPRSRSASKRSAHRAILLRCSSRKANGGDGSRALAGLGSDNGILSGNAMTASSEDRSGARRLRGVGPPTMPILYHPLRRIRILQLGHYRRRTLLDRQP